jgi:hypothetical protein
MQFDGGFMAACLEVKNMTKQGPVAEPGQGWGFSMTLGAQGL